MSQATEPSRAELSAWEIEVIALFVDWVQVLGVPKSVGQIYGLLFASPAPLSFPEIVEKLGLSKGSTSQGLQLLRSLGAVKIVETADERRDYFEPELGLRKLIGGMVKEKINPLVKEGTGRLARLQGLAGKATKASDAQVLKMRVAQLEAWRKQARFLLPVVNTFLRSPRG